MPNCTGIERSSPRLERIWAICSVLAASPARIAAGSPGVSRSMRKTSTATTSSTGIVDSRRRRMKVYISERGAATRRLRPPSDPPGERAPLGAPDHVGIRLVLLYVPVDVPRSDHPAGDVLARGERVDVFA